MKDGIARAMSLVKFKTNDKEKVSKRMSTADKDMGQTGSGA